jgi:predicted peptidase
MWSAYEHWDCQHRLESQPDFPFVVVSPQCPAGEIWTDVEAIDGLLDRVVHDYRIDPQRIYITGHSMGGRGALYFASRLPSRFAAVLSLVPFRQSLPGRNRSLKFRSGYFMARQTLPRPSLKLRS